MALSRCTPVLSGSSEPFNAFTHGTLYYDSSRPVLAPVEVSLRDLPLSLCIALSSSIPVGLPLLDGHFVGILSEFEVESRKLPWKTRIKHARSNTGTFSNCHDGGSLSGTANSGFRSYGRKFGSSPSRTTRASRWWGSQPDIRSFRPEVGAPESTRRSDSERRAAYSGSPTRPPRHLRSHIRGRRRCESR